MKNRGNALVLTRVGVVIGVLSALLPLPAAAAPPGAEPVTVFEDVGTDDTFALAIGWLAEQGITKGCNPPANNRFCPDDPVTRGQMAAFLHRALPDLELAYPDPRYSDGSSNTFQADIAWLARTGVTRGCNPPTNTRFCPDEPVTREEMAAFLVRALGLTANTHPGFDDVSSSNTFFRDIGKLATAGITKGCNPPANTFFCPDEPVTREQMAAFINRAFGSPSPWLRVEYPSPLVQPASVWFVTDSGEVLIHENGSFTMWTPSTGKTRAARVATVEGGLVMSRDGLIADSGLLWDPTSNDTWDMPAPPVSYSPGSIRVIGINDEQQGIGQGDDGGATFQRFHGVVWDYDDTSVTLLEQRTNLFAIPEDINNNGRVTGYYFDRGKHPLDQDIDNVIWNAETGAVVATVPNPTSGGGFIEAKMINDANEVLGSISNAINVDLTEVLFAWDLDTGTTRTLTHSQVSQVVQGLSGAGTSVRTFGGVLTEDGLVVVVAETNSNNGLHVAFVWNIRNDSIGPALTNFLPTGHSTTHPDRRVFVGLGPEDLTRPAGYGTEITLWELDGTASVTRFHTILGDFPWQANTSGLIAGDVNTGEVIPIAWIPPSDWSTD